MAEIEWTEEAKYWLQQIYDYVARDNEEAAWQVILGIYDRVQVLRQFPESGHRYEKHSSKHIRILLYGHYRIAYLVRDENMIHILGVLHAALDIDEHLRRILWNLGPI
jgi:plasmid stabilization system protein ParE